MKCSAGPWAVTAAVLLPTWITGTSYFDDNIIDVYKLTVNPVLESYYVSNCTKICQIFDISSVFSGDHLVWRAAWETAPASSTPVGHALTLQSETLIC